MIFLVMLFALVLLVTAFAGPSWSTGYLPGDKEEKTELGLWEQCTCNKNVPEDSKETSLNVISGI